ncbi:MAG: PilZ domain-containing protein [Candidatus Krumholzibacteria bacterium]|nr:PilZ domain-containing protein [Candidatus Krumholzibacteria bacterium]
MTFNERRRAPRIRAELPILLEGGPAEAGGKTLDISTSGVYFEVPHFIEPLTKVRMELLFPRADGHAPEGRISFDGIVVRTEPEIPSPDVTIYRTAVFFTYISETSLKVLSMYIGKRQTS